MRIVNGMRPYKAIGYYSDIPVTVLGMVFSASSQAKALGSPKRFSLDGPLYPSLNSTWYRL